MKKALIFPLLFFIPFTILPYPSSAEYQKEEIRLLREEMRANIKQSLETSRDEIDFLKGLVEKLVIRQ